MTKKKVFIISIIGVFLAIIFDFVYRKTSLSTQIYESFVQPCFYISLPLFILSLITYFLKEQVFRTWLHFAYWWIPLSLLFVYIASQSSGGGFGIPNVFDTESVSIIFSVLFFIISILLIFIKSFITKSK